MQHVDALSRFHNVLVLEANTFEQTLSIHQSADTDIQDLKTKLEEMEDPQFELINGLVYRKVDGRWSSTKIDGK